MKHRHHAKKPPEKAEQSAISSAPRGKEDEAPPQFDDPLFESRLAEWTRLIGGEAGDRAEGPERNNSAGG